MLSLKRRGATIKAWVAKDTLAFIRQIGGMESDGEIKEVTGRNNNILSVIENYRPDAVIVGTTSNDSIDRQTLKCAKSKSIRSIAIIDAV